MKKIFFLILFIINGVILLQSCKRQEEIEENQTNLNYKYRTYVRNNMLVFETKADFDYTIYQLYELDDKALFDFEDYLSFQSLRSVKSEEELSRLGIEDDLLATLLNPNGEIQINDKVYKLEINKAKCLSMDVADYIDKNSFTKKELVTEYSIYDYLDDNGNVVITGKGSSCSRNKKGPYYFINPNTNEKILEYKLVYQNALIYHSLLAKIKRTDLSSGGPINFGMNTVGGNNFYRKDGTSFDISINFSYYGNDRKYVKRYEYKLEAYKLEVQFFANDVTNSSLSWIDTKMISCSSSSGGGGGSDAINFGAAEIE